MPGIGASGHFPGLERQIFSPVTPISVEFDAFRADFGIQTAFFRQNSLLASVSVNRTAAHEI